MTLGAWLTPAVVVFCVSLLATNRYPADAVMVGVVALLFLAGVLTPAEALAGLSNQGMVTVLVMVAMVLVASLGILSMLAAAMLAAGPMLLLRCTSASATHRAVDWHVLLVIAVSFGIGSAPEKTGAANALAGALLALAGDDPWATLGLVFLATSIFTNLIINNAAAALMFSRALAAATRLEVSVLPFAIVIMKGQPRPVSPRPSATRPTSW